MNNFLELLERLSKPYILNKNVSLVELWTSANAIYTKNKEEIDSYVETTTPIYNNLLKIKGFPEILQKVQPTMNNVQPTVFGGKRSKRASKRTSKRTGKRTASKRISRRKSYYGGNLVLIGATVVFGYLLYKCYSPITREERANRLASALNDFRFQDNVTQELINQTIRAYMHGPLDPLPR